MIIGVDARSLSVPITGIGRYTLELLEEMVDLGHEWILYSHRPIINGDWSRVNVKTQTMNLHVRPFSTFWSQIILPFLLLKDSVDVFWAPGQRLPLFKPKKVSYVVTIHDVVWRHTPDTMRRFNRLFDSWLIPRAVKLSDAVIASSKSTANDLVAEIKDVKNKIFVIHLGVSSLEKLVSDKYVNYFNINGPYILFVGTLEPRKNLRRFLEAYSMIGEEIRNQNTLVIVGGAGWGSDNVLDIIKELNIEKFVIVLGYVSDEQLCYLYKSAKVFVMPSLYEGFGLPLVEAMSFGIPVLTSNVSSMPEITDDAALLINPTDIKSIKIGLKEILTNSRMRDEMCIKGRFRAKAFTWTNVAKQTLDVFKQAVNNHGND